jgi:alpha-ribazole phosphatase/probable phosphoglycerate mutase
MDAYPSLPAPDGESFESFRMRVLSATAAITATPCTGDIAIVTHAGVMQLLLTSLCGRTAQQAYEQTRDYCSIVPFQPVRVVQHV